MDEQKVQYSIIEGMKKYLILFIVVMLSIASKAQNIQLEYGKEFKVVAETEMFDDNSMSFLYTELVVENNKAFQKLSCL